MCRHAGLACLLLAKGALTAQAYPKSAMSTSIRSILPAFPTSFLIVLNALSASDRISSLAIDSMTKELHNFAHLVI